MTVGQFKAPGQAEFKAEFLCGLDKKHHVFKSAVNSAAIVGRKQLGGIFMGKFSKD